MSDAPLIPGDEPKPDGILRVCLMCGHAIQNHECFHVYSLDPVDGDEPGSIVYIHVVSCEGIRECRCVLRGR